MSGIWNAARDLLHFSGPGTLVVTSGGPRPPAEAWRDTHFCTCHHSGETADDADLDNDGAIHLWEHAPGRHPKAGDASGKPISNPGSSDFSFGCNRSKAAIDLLIDMEVSPFLAEGRPGRRHPPGSSSLAPRRHDQEFQQVLSSERSRAGTACTGHPPVHDPARRPCCGHSRDLLHPTPDQGSNFMKFFFHHPSPP